MRRKKGWAQLGGQSRPARRPEYSIAPWGMGRIRIRIKIRIRSRTPRGRARRSPRGRPRTRTPDGSGQSVGAAAVLALSRKADELPAKERPPMPKVGHWRLCSCGDGGGSWKVSPSLVARGRRSKGLKVGTLPTFRPLDLRTFGPFDLRTFGLLDGPATWEARPFSRERSWRPSAPPGPGPWDRPRAWSC